MLPGAVLNCLDSHHNVLTPTLGCIGPQQFKKASGVEAFMPAPASNSAFMGMIILQVAPSWVDVHSTYQLHAFERRRMQTAAYSRIRKAFGTKLDYIKAIGYVDQRFDDGLPTVTFVVEFNDVALADQFTGLNGCVELTAKEVRILPSFWLE